MQPDDGADPRIELATPSDYADCLRIFLNEHPGTEPNPPRRTYPVRGLQQ